VQEQSPSKFVRLRSSEASSLKNTLKKIVRDVTRKASDDDDDDLQVSSSKGVSVAHPLPFTFSFTLGEVFFFRGERHV
jgi:hypothetical protein